MPQAQQRFFLTVLSTVLIFSQMIVMPIQSSNRADAAALSNNPLSSPLSSVTWKDVMKTTSFDPINDQQSSNDSDLLGNSSHAMLQASKTNSTVEGTSTTVYYYKTRIGTLNNGNTSTSFYLGLDLDGDADNPVADVFVEANVSTSNGTYNVAYHKADPTQNGLSPSTTSWLNSSTNTAIEEEIYTQSKASYTGNHGFIQTVASGTNYVLPTAAEDLDSDGQKDKFITFGFTFSSLKAFAARAYPTKFTNLQQTNTVVLFTFTSTSQTSNGDIGGVDDRSANLTKTWKELGVTIVSSLDDIAAGSPAKPTVKPKVTNDLTPTVCGTALLKAGDKLDVDIGAHSFTYSHDGNAGNDTITLTLINGETYEWCVTIPTDLTPGTHQVVAKITRGTTTVTDATENELIVSNDINVSGISISSNAGTDKTYAMDDVIEISVVFSGAVAVSGIPKISLKIGDTIYKASYVTGTGTTTLKFRYTVVDGDLDLNGVSVPANSLELSGGTIKTNGGTSPAVLIHPSILDNANHLVDGIKPVDLHADGYDNQIDVYFTDDMNLNDENPVGNNRFKVISRSPLGTTVQMGIMATSIDPVKKKVTLTLSTSMNLKDTVTVTYTDATGANDASDVIQDLAGNDADSFALPVSTDDFDAIDAAIESAGKNSGDFNLDGILDRNQPNLIQVPLTSAAVFAAKSATTLAVKFGAVSVVDLSDSLNDVTLLANTTIKALNLAPIASAGGTGRQFTTPTTDIYELSVNATDGGVLPDLDPNLEGRQLRVMIELPAPVTGNTFLMKQMVNGNTVWSPYLDDQLLATYDSGATLIKDGTGKVTKIVLTLTDNGKKDLTSTLGLLSSTGFLGTKNQKAVITMSDYSITMGETSKISICFADAVVGFTASDLAVTSGTIGTLTGPVVNPDGTNCYSTTFTPSKDIDDPTNIVQIPAGSYTDALGASGTGGVSPNYSVYTKSPVIPVPVVGPVELIDGTDNGATDRDELTSKGYPVIDFDGSQGLKIDLYGPNGTKLTANQHYSLAYTNGTYKVTLLDAVPGGTKQPFGKYSFNGPTNNPASTSDGTYLIKASNAYGKTTTVGKFAINTAYLANKKGNHSKYISGYPDGTFRPDKALTRVELASIIARTQNKPRVLSAPTFTDIPSKHWAYDAVKYAVQTGLMKGATSTLFKPEASVTRADLVTFLAKVYTPVNSSAMNFSDITTTNALYPSASKVVSGGLMDAYGDGTFRPAIAVTRAEAVVIINRLLNRGPLHNVYTSPWVDIPNGHWAIGNIEEASLVHGYEIKSDLNEYMTTYEKQ